MAEKTGTAFGPAIPLFPPAARAIGALSIPLRTEPNGNQSMHNLTEDDKKLCAAFGLSEPELVRQRAVLANERKAGRSPASFPSPTGRAVQAQYGLTDDEMAVCRMSGMKPRDYVREKAAFRGNTTALAAKGNRGSPAAGMLRAHQEVDRAHDATYANAADHGDAWMQAPDGELLKIAISELQAFNLDKEAATYNRLLNGVMHAMALLARIAPAYADTKDFKV